MTLSGWKPGAIDEGVHRGEQVLALVADDEDRLLALSRRQVMVVDQDHIAAVPVRPAGAAPAQREDAAVGVGRPAGNRAAALHANLGEADLAVDRAAAQPHVRRVSERPTGGGG